MVDSELVFNPASATSPVQLQCIHLDNIVATLGGPTLSWYMTTRFAFVKECQILSGIRSGSSGQENNWGDPETPRGTQV